MVLPKLGSRAVNVAKYADSRNCRTITTTAITSVRGSSCHTTSPPEIQGRSGHEVPTRWPNRERPYSSREVEGAERQLSSGRLGADLIPRLRFQTQAASSLVEPPWLHHTEAR